MFILSKSNKRSSALLTIILFISLLPSSVATRAQEGKILPPREGSITDFANALDYATTKRLENMLANLKERGGIELAVVLVKTTGGKERSEEHTSELQSRVDIS